MSVLPQYDSSNIKQMSMLEHIRAKYSMYVGAGTLVANNTLFREVVDNSVDESLNPNVVYHIFIYVFTKGDRHQFIVVDHGRGIPCTKLKEICTEGFVSGKYSADAYNGVSIGTYGVGLKCTVSLSRRFMAISKRLDGFAGITVEYSKIKRYENHKAIDKIQDTVGTTIFYEPDAQILKETPKYMTDPEGLMKTLGLLEFTAAFKRNTKFHVVQVNGLVPNTFFDRTYQEIWNDIQGGFNGEILYETPIDIDPFVYSKQKFDVTSETKWKLTTHHQMHPDENVGYDIEIGCTSTCKTQFGLLTSVNYHIMSDMSASHVSVLCDAIKDRLEKYIAEDDDEMKLYFNTKYMLPLHGYISAFCKNASYINQTKDSFKDLEFEHQYSRLLEKFLKSIDESQWEALYDLISDDLEEKFTIANNRSLKINKSLKNIGAEIDKYIDCRIKNNTVTELFITEGDSAGDGVTECRDATFQAVLKMAGKPINAFIADSAKLKANRVFQNMIRLFGVSPRDTNLDNFNYYKVGLLADADPDGYHILSLLVGNIYKINPLILESGRVFIANPPLYVMERKDKSLFLRDQKALNDSRVKIYSSFLDIELCTLDGKRAIKLDAQTYRDFVYLVRRIGTIITDVANKLIIEPTILEQLTHCVDYLSISNLKCDKIKEALSLDRCEYQQMANTIVLDQGGVEITIPLNKLVSEINSYIIPELAQVRWDKYVPLVTTKNTGLYKRTPLTFMQIYNIFLEIDKMYPVHRIKGLGEMNIEQLRYTCVNPKTRTFSTITSVGDVDVLYSMLGVATEAKKQLVKADLNSMGLPELSREIRG